MIPTDYNLLIKAILEKCKFQLVQCIQDLSTSLFEEKLTFETRNVYETLAHLIDVCYAYQHLRTGKKYKWQSFTTDCVKKEDVFSVFLEVWEKTREYACQIDTEKEFLDTVEYLALHISYHVGQICALRMKIDPKWDAKTIYQYNKQVE